MPQAFLYALCYYASPKCLKNIATKNMMDILKHFFKITKLYVLIEKYCTQSGKVCKAAKDFIRLIFLEPQRNNGLSGFRF
jgi:hypothetical protein